MIIYEVWHPEFNYWFNADNKKSYRVFKSLGYKGRIKRPTNLVAHPLPAEVKHPA